jgi:hypothetical protein
MRARFGNRAAREGPPVKGARDIVKRAGGAASRLGLLFVEDCVELTGEFDQVRSLFGDVVTDPWAK